ncbi:MAG TPA: hypothetical protein IAD22_00705 [Candidatus Limousia pullorum]|uniref:Uncharacterized protein n=1 Tax=Candidatus Limousia pullorum TaxID=2840860 RepID=A0A9D1S7Q1_9FIRM|nr:hypothetical protein [Candidatus Limousia pullorum]
MKKVISISVALVILLSTVFLFSGCNWGGLQVTSKLTIDENFSGSRTVTFAVPESVYSENLDSNIKEAAPVTEDGTVTLGYSDLEEGGTEYTLSIYFSSQSDYVSRMESLLGRDVSVNLAQPDNIMAKGVRYTENFNTTELLAWLEPVLEEDDKAFGMSLECKGAVAEIEGLEYETKPTIDVNTIEGKPLQSIKVYTKNNKDGTYDRTFTILMDSNLYKTVGNQINFYFEAATDTEIADSLRWTEVDKSQQCQVVYTGLDMQQLISVTNRMFSVNDITISYGDTDNSSTPFIEGLAFDEKINLNAYVGDKNGNVPISYEYVLPEETTHGTATVLNTGIWEEQGEWSGNLYSLQYEGNCVDISIKDGIEFPVEKIQYTLQRIGDDNYRRVTEIYYKKDEESQFSGAEYACDYFTNKGADAQTRTEDEFEVCSLSIKGSAIELSIAEAQLFGGGNYFSQTVSNPALDIRTMTEIRDYVYIAPLLTEMNKEIPVYYTVLPSDDYKVNYLTGTDSGNAVKNEDGSMTITIKNGISDIYVVQSTPHVGKIIIYIVISVLITAAALYILRKLYYKNKRLEILAKKKGEEESSEFIKLSDLSSFQKGQKILKSTGKKIKKQGKAFSDSRKKKQEERIKKRDLEFFNDELYDDDLDDF